MSGFTRAQVEQLLKPINGRRVLKDVKGHSHVSQQDVTAHLIRMFGFGGFDVEITGPELVFETERVNPKTGEATGRWDVCYRAMCRLTVKDQHGDVVAVYEDGSTATAQNQTRGDAHDLAYKSAISLSKKRAAINLGDQFGLSLYNRGQLTALVMGTLVMPEGPGPDVDDIQDGVEQQVSLGNDEIDREPDDWPRNKNGSLSRSQMTDEELARAGTMTGPQLREHGKLARSGEPPANRIQRMDGYDPDEDPWAYPLPQGEQAQRDIGA